MLNSKLGNVKLSQEKLQSYAGVYELQKDQIILFDSMKEIFIFKRQIRCSFEEEHAPLISLQMVFLLFPFDLEIDFQSDDTKQDFLRLGGDFSL